MLLDRCARQPISDLACFIPLLAAAAIKQLTCLLTRSLYLCCTAASCLVTLGGLCHQKTAQLSNADAVFVVVVYMVIKHTILGVFVF